MLQDTITLISGAEISNMTTASGTSDPGTAIVGALFYRTDTTSLRVYTGSVWTNVSSGAGTVTSVQASGGSTGLSFSGGPITTSGTLTLSGTLALTNGGTGATTQASAANAVLPSQTSQSGKYLTTNGTNVSWATVSAGVTTFNTRSGAVTLSSSDVTTALAYTPINPAAAASITNTFTFDGTHTVTGLPTPTNSTDATNKAYVDAVAAGLSWKLPVVAATTVNLSGTYVGTPTFTLTNSGTQVALSLDGVSLSVGNRVLLKNQTTQSQNGIYVVTTVGTGSTNWVLTRTTDFNEITPIDEVNGAAVYVTQGTINSNTGWTQIDKVITFDTSPIAWAQFSGVGAGVSSITAGTGITVNQATGAVTVTATSPVLTATYIGYGSGSNVLTGTSDFTWSASTQTLTLGTSATGPIIQATSGSSAGNTFAITGSAGSAGNGGAVTITGGTASSGSIGGAINILGGTLATNTSGGPINITAGSAGSGNNNKTGGNITIIAGNSDGAAAGTISIQAGTSNGPAAANGGNITIVAGGAAGGFAGTGGTVTIQGGTGGSGIGTPGGPVAIVGGISASNGGGSLYFQTGTSVVVNRLQIDQNGQWLMGSGAGVGPTAGQVLTSVSTGGVPTWQTPASSGVTSISGTANQITASASTGAITLSLPSAITLNNLTVTPVSGQAVKINGVAATTVFEIASGNTTANADIYVHRTSSTVNSNATGPNITLVDTAGGQTASTLQQSGGQTELWQTSSGTAPTAAQMFYITSNYGLVMNGTTTGGAGATGGSQGAGTINAKGLFVNGVSVSTGAVTSITGTANQITASASTGAITLSLPTTLTLGTSATGPTIQATSGSSAGNTFAITGSAAGAATNAGGSINITAGANNGAAAGGSVTIATGTAASGTGGSLIFKTGTTTSVTALTINSSGAIGTGSSPAYGTSGQVLTSNGSSAVPTWAPAGALTATYTGAPSLTTGTATTVQALPTSVLSTYIVSAGVNAGDPTSYGVTALVMIVNGTARLVNLATASLLTVTMSGLNVQITQSSGATQITSYSILKIAG